MGSNLYFDHVKLGYFLAFFRLSLTFGTYKLEVFSLFVYLLSAVKKDLETTRKKYSECTDKLMEKNRQHQKLQVHKTYTNISIN